MPEKPYLPPYNITDMIIHLVAEISEQVGAITIKGETAANPKLRRENQLRSIHASLAIENNSLSLEQVTDIINGKRVLGPPNEIREVKNAYEAYNLLLTLDPFAIEDMLAAHKVLTVISPRHSSWINQSKSSIAPGSLANTPSTTSRAGFPPVNRDRPMPEA